MKKVIHQFLLIWSKIALVLDASAMGIYRTMNQNELAEIKGNKEKLGKHSSIQAAARCEA
jgi:hypothetical protein